MEYFSNCCRTCRFGKIRNKSCNYGVKNVVWCKKHKEIFSFSSCCESYEREEIINQEKSEA